MGVRDKNHTLRVLMKERWRFNEVIHVEIQLSQNGPASPSTTTEKKVAAALGFFFFYFFFRHILTNYINGKQMVTVSLAQFHHLLLVMPLKSKALCKDYSRTMILLKARGHVLIARSPHVFITTGTRKHVFTMHTSSTRWSNNLSMVNDF